MVGDGLKKKRKACRLNIYVHVIITLKHTSSPIVIQVQDRNAAHYENQINTQLHIWAHMQNKHLYAHMYLCVHIDWKVLFSRALKHTLGHGLSGYRRNGIFP